jgi:hypothetical protein
MDCAQAWANRKTAESATGAVAARYFLSSTGLHIPLERRRKEMKADGNFDMMLRLLSG